MSLRTIRTMDGSLVRRLAQPGVGLSTVSVSTLFWFIPDTPAIVRAEVEESFVSRIKVGMQAEILPENDESLEYQATVKRIGLIFGPKRPSSYDPEQGADVRAVEVVLDIAEKAPLLLGQRVVVRFLRK